jgi:glycerophosphoryl diester phosphodiesterase
MTLLEADVHILLDNTLLIYHDYYLNPDICLNGIRKPVKEKLLTSLTYSNVKNLDCGSLPHPDFPFQKTVKNTSPPLLSDLFEFVLSHEKTNLSDNGLINFLIELKFNPETRTSEEIKKSVKLVVREIEKYHLTNRCIIQSFTRDALAEVKKINPNLKTSALFSPSYRKVVKLVTGRGAKIRKQIIQKTLDIGADIIAPHYLYVNSRFIRDCHKRELEVYIWTVNDEEDMSDLLKIGVDGIITDYPDRLFRVLMKHSGTMKSQGN